MTHTEGTAFNGQSQAQSKLDTIMEFHERWAEAQDTGDGGEIDQLEQEVLEYPLSVEFRSGWWMVGQDTDPQPAEFRILLCTGGPAVQIVGRIDMQGSPEDVDIQYQDWGTPWTTLRLVDDYNKPDWQQEMERKQSALQWFAEQFIMWS